MACKTLCNSVIQRAFSLLYLQVRHKENRKNARNSKKFNLGSGDDIFLKNFGKIHKF